MYYCKRCSAITDSPVPDRCGRCKDWPDYDVQNPTIGDLGRLAEHLYSKDNKWTDVVMGLIDAMKATKL